MEFAVLAPCNSNVNNGGTANKHIRSYEARNAGRRDKNISAAGMTCKVRSLGMTDRNGSALRQ